MIKARIAFLIYTLKMGGAQKIAIDLASYLKKYYEIYLIILGKENVFKIDDEIKVIQITQTIMRPLQIIKETREIVKKNRITFVMSFMERANFINHYAFAGLKNITYCLTVHNAPSLAFKNRGILKNFIINWCYKRFPKTIRIITVSKGIQEELERIYGFKNITVLYNAINPELLKQQTEKNEKSKNKGFNIVNVGRLLKQKNHILLLKIIKRLKEEISDIQCQIIGNGPLRHKLEKYCSHNNLDRNVTFLGERKEPFSHITGKPVFLLTSHFEGFGIVLVESLFFGIPVVSINCKHGPKEILQDENDSYGYVIEENRDEDLLIEQFVDHLKKLSENEEIYGQFQKKGKTRAKDFYIDRIGNNYYNYINQLLANTL